jgi:hypothetical protein
LGSLVSLRGLFSSIFPAFPHSFPPFLKTIAALLAAVLSIFVGERRTLSHGAVVRAWPLIIELVGCISIAATRFRSIGSETKIVNPATSSEMVDPIVIARGLEGDLGQFVVALVKPDLDLQV